MARYTTDFSEYTVGTTPEDWSCPWTSSSLAYTAEVNSGEYTIGSSWLSVVNASSARKVIVWDDVGAVADVDIIAKFSCADSALAASGVRVAARVSGAAGSENGYFLDIQNSYVYLGKYVGGASSQIQQVVYETGEALTEFWTRFSVQGTALKCKVWAVDCVEPVDWLIQGTDTSLSSGSVGVGLYDTVTDFSCDYFQAATGGDTTVFPTGWGGGCSFGSLNIGSTSVPGPFVVAAGGTFTETGKLLSSVNAFISGTHTAQARLAVYSGGSLTTGPTGATLLYDFGQTSGTDLNYWHELVGASVEVPSAPLWVIIKTNSSGFAGRYSAGPGNTGNFQVANGRFLISAGLSNDPAVEFPDTLPSLTGGFSASRYMLVVGLSGSINLVSTVSPSSATSDVTATMDGAAATNLAASVQATSSTPSGQPVLDDLGDPLLDDLGEVIYDGDTVFATMDMSVDRNLTATAAATSSTPATTALTTRGLTFAATQTSATSGADVLLIRGVSSAVAQTSTTSAPAGTSARSLAATVAATSSTVDILAFTTRKLSAEIAAVSSTTQPTTTTTRNLAASTLQTSSTNAPIITMPVAGTISLVALVTAASVTSGGQPILDDLGDPILDDFGEIIYDGDTVFVSMDSSVVRDFTASVTVASIASTPTVLTTRKLSSTSTVTSSTATPTSNSIRKLFAATATTSSTPVVTETTVRKLSIGAVATSSTPIIVSTTVRKLGAAAAQTSSTATVISTMTGQVRLVANAAATTSNATPISLTARNLTADVSTTSSVATAEATSGSVKNLSAGVTVTTSTGQVASISRRGLTASIAVVSSSAAISSTLLRGLFADVAENSSTSDISIFTTYRLQTHIAGTSSTNNAVIATTAAGMGRIDNTYMISLTQKRGIVSRTAVRRLTSRTPQHKITTQ